MKKLYSTIALFFSLAISAQEVPDYFIQNFTINQTSVAVGEKLLIEFDLNVDLAEFQASNVQVNIALSDDNILSTGDRYIYGQNLLLGPHAIEATITDFIDIGDKYVILIINGALQSRESNYTNNKAISAAAIEITEKALFDIVADTLIETITDVAIAGSTFETQLTLSGQAQDFFVSYYLSSDSTLDSDDKALGSEAIPFLFGETNFLRTHTIPIATDPGEWHILAFADSQGDMFESDESNNLAVYTVPVSPPQSSDFIVDVLSMRINPLELNTSSIIDFRVQNQVGTSNTRVNFYLSHDSTFSSDDQLLSSTTVTVSGQDATKSILFNNENYVGTSYLLAVADPDLEIKETDEANNVMVYEFELTGIPVPDLAFLDILIPTTLSTGKAYLENYSIQNLNETPSSLTHETVFFLSADSTLDASDILISRDLSFVPAFNSPIELTTNISLDARIVAGEYLLLGFTDFLDQVKEENETNNDTILQVSIVNPDLEIATMVSSTAISGAGLSFNLDITVKNNSANATARTSLLGVYLSLDETLDSTDYYFGDLWTPAIEPATTLANPLIFDLVVPKIIDAGDYFLLAKTDVDSLVAETNEDNNISTLPIEITLPDLQVKSPIVNPSTIYATGNVTLEFRVDNNASIQSPPTITSLYLSLDDQFQLDEDIFLGNQSIETLPASGKSTDKSLQVNIPSIEEANYKILFIVDADSLISETNEANNISTSDILVTNPDIIPANIQLESDLVGIGEQVAMSFNFTNQGAGRISPTSYTVSLTGDGLIEDLLLTSASIPLLEPSASTELINLQLTIPSYIDSGSYYLKIIADVNDLALETNEENNADSIALNITTPDLTLSNIIASPSVISVGFNTRVEYDVENIGKVNAEATLVQYVLSQNQTIDDEDHFFFSEGFIQALDTGKDVSISQLLNIPSAMDPGDYFIIVKVDPFEQLPEVNENNNTIAVAVSVRVPDLVVLNQEADKSIVGSSENLILETRVQNMSSDAKSPISYVGYFLSSNESLDEEDIFLGESLVETLEFSTTSTKKELEFTVPESISAGNYFILFQADFNEYVNESNNSNNVGSFPIEVTNPDFVPSNLVLSSTSLSLGQSFEISSLRITNSGVSKSAPGFVSYFLSTTEVVNDSSVLVGSKTGFDVIVAGENTVLASSFVQIPQFIQPTDYFIVAKVDADSLIAESDETNNQISKAITILSPDLSTVNNETNVTEVRAGASFIVSYNLKNNGEVASKASTTQFSLVKDDSLSIILGSKNEAVLEAFGTSTQIEQEFLVSEDLDTGVYKLIIKADFFNNNIESNEENNISELEIKILPVDFELRIATLSYNEIEPDSVNMQSTSSSLNYALEGYSSVNTNTLISYQDVLKTTAYLSSDEIFDENDRFLGVSSGWTNENDSTYRLTGSLLFPYDEPKGVHYVIFQFDSDSVFNESDEDNNLITAQINYGNGIKPDIKVLDQQVFPSKFTSDKTVNIIHRLTNDGKRTISQSFNNEIYLSSDETIDASDSLFAGSSIRLVDIGEVESLPYSILSDTRTAGNYFVIGVNDLADSLNEESETNNIISTPVTYYDPLPIDFLVTCASQLPYAVRAGDNLKYGFEIENKGSGTRLGTLTTQVFFSSDMTISEDDSLFTTQVNDAIDPHSILGLSYTAAIPEGLSGGTYYLIVKTDSEELYDEIDEANNTFPIPIDVLDAILPDYIIDILDVNPSNDISANTEFTMNLSITNNGGGVEENVSIGVYLGKINSIESAQYLGSPAFNVNISGYSTLSTSLIGIEVPRDIASGEYVLFAKIDDEDEIFESDESNNIDKKSVTILDAQIPELSLSTSIDELVTYEGEIVDQTFTFSATLENAGDKSVSAEFGIYFSLDDQFDSNDILVSDLSTVFVSAFNIATTSTSIQLPDLLAGEYYILAVVDPSNEIFESDENNNQALIQLIVNPSSKPDLTTLNGLSLSKSSVGINDVLQISQVVSNLDRGSVDSVLVKFYLSNDPNKSNNDIELGNITTSFINGNGVGSGNTSVIIPTVSQGSYFVIAIADPDNVISESDESNNETFVSLEISSAVSPDLTASITSLDASVNVNTQMSVSYSVSNIGDGAAPAYEVGFYLSKDDLIDGSDHELLIIENQILTNGSTLNSSIGILIPQSIAPGDYNLIVGVDPNELLSEELETNNTAFAAVEILEPLQPDLVIQINSGPAFINAGQSASVGISVFNIGGGAADSPSDVELYISTDDQFDKTEDLLIGATTIDLLFANQSATKELSVHVPNVTSGVYTVFAVVDANNTISEADETNNIDVSSVEVGSPIFPDLVINALTTSTASVNAGNNINMTATILNQGDATASKTVIEFYLSVDDVISAGDQLIGIDSLDQLVSSGSVNRTITARIPINTSPNTYFILAKVNPNAAIEEEDLTNNSNSVEVEVLERLFADLKINSASVQPAQIPIGQQGNVSVSILNAGDALADASTLSVYLSTDGNLSTDDLVIGSKEINLIDINGSVISQVGFTVSSSIATGVYTLFVEVDANNVVQESNETNNVYTLTLEVLESLKSDLIIDQLSFASQVNAGGTLAVSFDLKNVGEIGSLTGEVGVYFSEDNVLDTSDESISILSTSPLNAGASDEFNVSVPIPLERSVGDYFIIVVADHSEIEVEVDETNNILSKGIQVSEPLPGNLTIGTISLSATSVEIGEQLTISSSVNNSSSNATLSSSAGLYLSDDGALTSADQKLATASVSILEGNSSSPVSFTVSFDETIAPGDYFLIIKADDEDIINETSEADNTNSAQIAITIKVLGLEKSPSVIVYPNPVLTTLSIENKNAVGPVLVTIYNLSGKVLINEEHKGKEFEIDVSKLAAGEYIIRIINNGEENRIPFIKE